MCKVVVIQDSPVFRDFIVEALVDNFVDMEVSAFTVQEYKELVVTDSEVPWDILILDIDTDEEYLRLINSYKYNHKKVIALTSNERHPRLLEFFQYNLDGFFYPKMGVTDIIYAVSEILLERKFIHPAFSSLIIEDYLIRGFKTEINPTSLLTDREWSVLQLLAIGKGNSEIADSLLITEKTVKNFISSILKKLHVKNRTEAVIYAYRHEWIQT